MFSFIQDRTLLEYRQEIQNRRQQLLYLNFRQFIWLCPLTELLYPGTSKTVAQIGLSFSLAAFCCHWNTVTPCSALNISVVTSSIFC